MRKPDFLKHAKAFVVALWMLFPPPSPLVSFADALASSEPPSLDGIALEVPDESPSGKARALVWQAEPRDSSSLVHIVSPGALVPATAMRTFARTLAQKQGAKVVVVDYDWPVFRESPAEQAKAMTLAKHFGPTQRIEVFGHSAGGAVLAPLLDTHRPGVERVVMFGVSRLFAEPAAPTIPVTLLAGTRDGLVTEEGLANLGTLFETTPRRVPGVNHFCVVEDNAGSPDSRALDRETPLNAQQCAERILEAWFQDYKK